MSIKGDISISGNRPPLTSYLNKQKGKSYVWRGKPETYLRLFQILQDAAVAGERCPQTHELRHLHKIPEAYRPTQLADMGWVRVEIFALNWRVVEIMIGDHKGARTKEAPSGGQPYRVFYHPEAV